MKHNSRPLIAKVDDGIRIVVHVVPNAKDTEILMDIDGSLMMRVNAPPIKGKANREIVKWLSKRLKKPSSQVRIIAGLTSNLKTLKIIGIDESTFLEAIGSR
jgi:uncharacterized protein (TIGR00251 family)